MTTELSKLRLQIDTVDDQLIHLLAERMKLCHAIGEYKKKNHVTPIQSKRYNELVKRLCIQGVEEGLTEQFVKDIMDIIHQESVRRQKILIDGQQ